jgi:hypothetical protein
LLYVIDTRTKVVQILQLYYGLSSRGAGGNGDAAGPQSVGSFFGFRVGRACGIRATRAWIGHMDVILSDLGQVRRLGSFGCGVFARGALAAGASFPALVVSDMASTHLEEGRTRTGQGHPRWEGKRLKWMGDLVGAER